MGRHAVHGRLIGAGIMDRYPRLRMGTLGLYCHDLGKMRDLYARVLGLTITDEDLERGICFLSAAPDVEHHELVLAQAKDPARKTHNVQQISFKVTSLLHDPLRRAPAARRAHRPRQVRR
jgi:catechol-2,3-dioxygenase